jgi:hypothetical protein
LEQQKIIQNMTHAKWCVNLGVLSLLFGFITGIPAIITGHIALSNIKKSPTIYSGKGLAFTGLILGYISTIFTCLYLIIVFYSEYPVVKTILNAINN